MFNLSTTRFNSTCADIYADTVDGSVTVLFNDSNKVYRYFNVSRRAIFNLCNNRNMSVGFWLNDNVLNNKRVVCFS